MTSPLDSRQLRAFVTLSRTGSFTQTARELHLTQSGISHSIKALESDIGCRLLDRLGKKVVLTQAGEQFLQHATKILQEMESARVALSQLGKWGQGRLRLGVSTTACQYLLPTVLREFKESFPDHSISIVPGDTPDLVALLLKQQADLALCLDPGKDPQLDSHHLFTDELQFVVSATHPWARTGRVDRSEIPRMSYILYRKASVTFRLVQEYFRQEEMVLNSVIELGSMEATKAMVKLGLGISILAPWIARKEIEDGSLVTLPLGRRKLQRHWGILHWRGKRLSLAEETFVGLCRSACTDVPLNAALG
jgi:DNA-binding transcriptional LysR family regulator